MIVWHEHHAWLLGKGGRRPSVIYLAVLLALTGPANLAGQWFETDRGTSLWFPAAALGFAILLRYGLRWAPVLAALRLATVYAFDTPQQSTATVVGATVVITAAYALAAAAVRALQVDLALRRLRDAAVLLGVAAIGALLAATGGTAVVAASGGATRAAYVDALLDFWLGDAAAIGALTPAVLVVAAWIRWGRAVRPPRWSQLVETAAQLTALTAVGWWAVGSASSVEPRRLYLVFLPLGWLAIRRGINGAALGAALGATAITVFAHGSDWSTGEVRALELFLAAFAVGGVCLGARESERRDAVTALEGNERRSRGVLESATEAFVAIDMAGTITDWNAAATKLFGRTRGEVVGQPLTTTIIPERYREAHEAELARYRESGRSDMIGRRLQLAALHREGRELPIELMLWRADTSGEVHALIHDLSGRLPAAQTLRESEEPLQLMLENTVDYAIYMLDARGYVATWNVGAERLYGYQAQGIIGRHFSVLYPVDRRDESANVLAQTAEQGRFAEEEWQRRHDGSEFWTGVVLTASYEDDGRLRGFGTVTHDLTERKAAEEKLTALATHDSLTGLPNRSLLLDRLAQALARSRRSGAEVAVMFVDLDRFKTVNDGWGHETGDLLLRLVADRLRSVLRPSDTAGRLGGDEFVVICEDLADEDQAEHIALRLEGAIDRPVDISGTTVTISASVGIAMAEDGRDPEDLLRHADQAMYSAKEHGRAQHRVYRQAQHASATLRLHRREQLRLAIDRDEFSLAYQPVADIHTGDVIGLEALVRWKNPAQGLLLPGAFIPIAEEDGLISRIGGWVLRTACAEFAGEARKVDWAGMVAVNVSGHQLTHPDFLRELDDSLAETGMPAERLCLETTETVLMTADHSTRGVISRLKDRGVRLALDDFGTGYSSLSYLRQFPFDILKIDRTFIAGLDANRHDRAVIAAIISLADALGLDVVAEGVETARQLDWLSNLGGQYAQGYYLARPTAAGQARDLASHGVRRRATATPPTRRESERERVPDPRGLGPRAIGRSDLTSE